jgi:hypothetical protein
MIPIIKLISFSALHFFQFTTSIIFAAGIATQAAYESNCLLFVENYRLDDGLYKFDADSPICTVSLSYGVTSALISSALFALRLYTSLKNITVAPKVDIIANVLLSVWYVMRNFIS